MKAIQRQIARLERCWECLRYDCIISALASGQTKIKIEPKSQSNSANDGCED